MFIDENFENWRKALATDSTASSFASKIPKTAMPSGDGVHIVGRSGVTKQRVMILPYATTDDDATFSMRLIGWKKLPAAGGDKLDLWVPVVLTELACTQGQSVGVANTNVAAAMRFADTVSIVSNMGNADLVDIQSPVQNLIAHARVLLQSFEIIEFTFDSTAAGTTAMNALFCLY